MKKPHYAWAVCLGCSIMMLTCIGLVSNVFSAAQPYILSAHPYSNAQISAITTIRSVFYLLSLVLCFRFYKLFGYRLGCCVSTLLAAGAYLLFAFADSLPVCYLAAVIAGLSYGFGSMIPASILISRWFTSHRGMALGICSASTGLVTVIFSPILTTIIQNRGLQAGFLVTAAVCIVCAAIAFALIRQDPALCGMTPLGGTPTVETKKTARKAPAFSKWNYAVLLVFLGLTQSICGAGFSHLIVLFSTSGQDPLTASLAFSVSGLCLMLGKCLYGAMYDRFGGIVTNILFFFFLSSACAICFLAADSSTVVMFAACILYGMGASLSTIGASTWAADFSDDDTFATQQRRFQIACATCLLPMSFAPGLVADLTGSYAPAFGIFFVILLLSLGILLLAYRFADRLRRQNGNV